MNNNSIRKDIGKVLDNYERKAYPDIEFAVNDMYALLLYVYDNWKSINVATEIEHADMQ